MYQGGGGGGGGVGVYSGGGREVRKIPPTKPFTALSADVTLTGRVDSELESKMATCNTKRSIPTILQ